jgi:hypothetical protein
MVTEGKNINQYFISIVMMLASACWQQLGKVPSPVSNKIEKDTASAQVTIDILEMLRDKTKGNLTPDEEKLINNTIADLQINFADEVSKVTKTEEKKN